MLEKHLLWSRHNSVLIENCDLGEQVTEEERVVIEILASCLLLQVYELGLYLDKHNNGYALPIQ